VPFVRLQKAGKLDDPRRAGTDALALHAELT